MYLLEFIVRKINNKTNFNQRDQYKNYSTFLLFNESFLPDKFREMTKHSNPALRTPV